MATVKEMMMDAAAGLDTAAMMSAGDTFEGTLDTNMDVDWIRIELEAGKEYTISVNARPTEDDAATTDVDESDTGLVDSILTVFDSKGGMVDMNDDVDAAKGMLNSSLKVTPGEDSVYYIAVSAYTGNPGVMNDGDYSVTVMERDLGPADINATSDNDHKLTGTSAGEKIAGMGGNDTLNGMGGDDELSGNAGNDLLIGGPGADTLSGGPGADDTISYRYSPMGVTINLATGTARGGDADGDTIVDMGDDRIENVMGSMYDDTLTGSSAANKLWGLGGNDELDGGRRVDHLYGGDGDDDLDGGAGDDMLEGGAGADMLTGGEDNDTASYSMSMMGVTVRLHSGQAMGGDAEGDTWNLSETVEYTDSDEEMATATVADIENLTGSANADILAGDLRDNTIMGGGGDDKIYGGPNPADADKESGADLSNADTLMGQGGNDMIFGGVGNDTLDGGDGDDMLNGGAGADTFTGGAGDDMIYADATDIYDVDAAAGTRAFKTAGLPIINGGEGNDTVSFAKLEDAIGDSSATAFTLGLLDDGTGTGTVADGVENVIGTQDDDFITGNAADNVIEGGEGGDTLVGGTGEDTLSYEGSDDWVRITLNAGAPATASRGHASGDDATAFENVRGSAFDDDLTGDTGANKLWGLAGDDDIDGAGGNDMVEGGAGADELDGGYTPANEAGDAAGDPATDAGNRNFEVNTLSYASSDAGVTVNLMTASVSGGHATGDTIETYEEDAPLPDDTGNQIDVATFANVTGSMHNDHLTGNHHNNHLAGGGGDDTLRGGAGADRVIGGPGADTLDGGEDMGEKNNMVPDTSDGAAEGDMVAASIDWAVYKHAMEGVTVDLSTNRGTGGEAMGDTLANIELIWGSEHADTYISGPGGDIIEGDGGSDTVSYEASSLGVTVDLSSDTQHTTVPLTPASGDDPLVQFPNTDPDADTTGAASGLAGVPRLDAMGNPFVDANSDGIADPGDNIEDEDDNPNANGAAGDKLRSIENLTGSDQKDILTGDGQNNVLKGMGGDDVLAGGSTTESGGDDKLYGGDGDDTLSAVSGANMLDGGAGDDTITGGSGNDTINGGAGDDQMSGGGGQDTFVFSPDDGEGDDVITGPITLANAAIDLSAYDLSEETLIDLIDLFGGNVRIDLTSVGGGKIVLDGVTDLASVGTVTDGELTALTMFGDANDDGVFDAGEGGFIIA